MPSNQIDIEMQAQAYANLQYEPKFYEEERSDGTKYVVAYNPEIEGCVAHGTTRDEAVALLNEMRAELFEEMLKRDIAPPTPYGMAQVRQVYNTAFVQLFEVDFGSVPATGYAEPTQDVQSSERQFLVPTLVAV